MQYTQSTQMTQRSQRPASQRGKHEVQERKPLPVTACALHPGGDCSGQSWEPWGFKSANPPVQGPHPVNGKNEVQPASPTLHPVPDSGQSSGIYPGPSLRREAPTNLLSTTSRQALAEVLAWSPMCPEQTPGLRCGQERRSWSCPSPSISPLPDGPRAADPKCPLSMTPEAPTSGMRTL